MSAAEYLDIVDESGEPGSGKVDRTGGIVYTNRDFI